MTPAPPHGADAVRTRQLQTLVDFTGLPTASGREQRVIEAVRAWVAARPDLALRADRAGNLVVEFLAAGRPPADTPLFITAHLDHPAFVVESVIPGEGGSPGRVEMSFRGGVMDVFFEHAPVVIHLDADRARSGRGLHATLMGRAEKSSPAGRHYVAEVHEDDEPGAPRWQDVRPGDIATWLLEPAEIDPTGLLHAPACDDLAGVAAALSALDGLRAARAAGEPVADVRLLFTRAEEIGFLGAIAACREGTLPRGARVLALENSRAFPESPVGAGPIVRVGDRLSVFTAWLTAACAARAEELFGTPAVQGLTRAPATPAHRPWQRKLMAGGACEASVYCRYGYDATCLCLPLGNYHNMPHLDALQADRYDAAQLGPPRAAREFIHCDDYLGLVDLLIALGLKLPEVGSGVERFEALLAEKGYVLNPPAHRD
jgi:putative aminopeptidase FrvX